MRTSFRSHRASSLARPSWSREAERRRSRRRLSDDVKSLFRRGTARTGRTTVERPHRQVVVARHYYDETAGLR